MFIRLIFACAFLVCGGARAAAPSELRFEGDGLEWRPTPTSLAVPAVARLTFRTYAGAITKAVMLVRDAVSDRRLSAVELGPQDGIIETGALESYALRVSLRVEQAYAGPAGGNETFWDDVYLPLTIT